LPPNSSTPASDIAIGGLALPWPRSSRTVRGTDLRTSPFGGQHDGGAAAGRGRRTWSTGPPRTKGPRPLGTRMKTIKTCLEHFCCPSSTRDSTSLAEDLAKRAAAGDDVVVVSGDMAGHARQRQSRRDPWPQCGFCLPAGRRRERRGWCTGRAIERGVFPIEHTVSPGT